MTTTSTRQRPALSARDPGFEKDHAPLSRMAVCALGIGIISLLAPLSTTLIILPMLAIPFGAVVVWKISRDGNVRGTWLAQLGLGLGVVSAAWAVTATLNQSHYLINQAGKNAQIFLQTLARGEKYKALELRKVEMDRQIDGTNLEEYYSQLTEEDADSVRSFLSSEAAIKVMNSGADAQWELSKGIQLKRIGGSLWDVTVEMVNAARPSEKVVVDLRRDFGYPDGKPTAIWNVTALSLAE